MLLLAGLVWAGWYGYHTGFTRKWRRYVIAEFRKHGVEISFEQLALDPFAGLVARDVVIKNANEPGKVVAVINRAVLDINYGNFLHGEPFINAIDLRDASLSLPLNPRDRKGPKVEISRLNARLLLPPHQIYLAHAEALLYGVRISATGRLINPEAYQPSEPASDEDAKNRAALLENLIVELKKLSPETAPPSIEVSFSGDLAVPGSIFVEGTITGDKLRFGEYRVASLATAFRFQDGVGTLKKLAITDDRGSLDASGRFSTSENAGEFHVRSTLNAQALLRDFVVIKPLDEVTFYSPPALDVSGKIDTSNGLKIHLSGNVALQKFAVRSAVFDGFRTNFSWDGANWYVTDLSIANKTGALTASALRTAGGFRLKLQSSINPKTLLPLFSGADTDFFNLWEFDQPPQIQFTMSGPSPDPALCEGDGEIRFGRTRFHGVPMSSGTAKIRIHDKVIRYENFRVERAEGDATGTFLYDFARRELRLEGIRSRLNPSEVIAWVNPDFLDRVKPYRFIKSPNLAVDGVVQFGGGKNTRLEIAVDASDGMEYVFLKKTLLFRKISGRLLFTDEHLKISDLDGTLFTGRLRGDADFSFSKKNPGYTANMAVEKMDFEQFTNLYFNRKDSKGELSGTYQFTGTGSDARCMTGKGEAVVTNGNVFAVPFLGPLSVLLNDVIPGVGYNTARRASVNFDIADGAIQARDFLVQGGGFNMSGGGELFFLDDKMNFRVRMNAQSVPGVVLFPVSKIFEYVSDGSMSKPEWRLKAVPRIFPQEKKP